jgi:hypothetical protein
MVTNSNQFRASDMTAPAEDGVALVKAAADLQFPTRAIYVGVAGDVEAKMKSGNIVMYKNMAVGWHPIQIYSITNNTVATNVVGVF